MNHSLVYNSFPGLLLWMQLPEKLFYGILLTLSCTLHFSLLASGLHMFYPSKTYSAGLPLLQLQHRDASLGTANRNEGGKGTDGEWSNIPQL